MSPDDVAQASRLWASRKESSASRRDKMHAPALSGHHLRVNRDGTGARGKGRGECSCRLVAS